MRRPTCSAILGPIFAPGYTAINMPLPHREGPGEGSLPPSTKRTHPTLNRRMSSDHIKTFITRWSISGGAERANYALFLSELCDLLDVPRPEPTQQQDDDNAYVFERRVVFINPDGSESFGRIDLYKRGCFVLETKQGIEKQDEEQLLSDAAKERKKRRLKGHGKRGTSAWNDTLLRARGQAEQYARALTGKESRPPFLVVVDVGHTIDLYAEFTQTGGTYVAFPDPQTNRIKLDQLSDPKIREHLRALWLDPLSLDPARRSAKVAREIAAKLAQLAKSFEAEKHDPQDVAQFLMRCLFTMFAEDVGLLPKHGFRDMLKALDDPALFKPMAEDLWRQMNVGGFSAHFRKKLLQFNGGLFADPSALPINHDQLDLLIEASGKEWSDVEPAIFGTLLERALSTTERHKLGAHYTPRAYVERLVMPTVIEPIRKEWDGVCAAAILHAQQGNRDAAVKELEAFHDRLCEIRVLDPACGSGNFLYVTLEHLKRIEGEVFSTYQSIAERQTLLESGHTVDPHQLLGIEVNPRAAAIADIVLWIGYLQWHFRTRGNVNPPQPVIKNFKNIECRDALLMWTSREPLLDEKGKPVTHWDGRTTKTHPVTGEEVPDETFREISYKYVNPKKAEWPKANYVVGNPPFIGNKKMRFALGDGYVDAIRSAHDDVPGSLDFVMYWWNHAANLVRSDRIHRFGFITTNSITQSNTRTFLDTRLNGKSCVSLLFAIADHPWVEASDGASVRIAMTVGGPAGQFGTVGEIIDECAQDDDSKAVELSYSCGPINSNLAIGTSFTAVAPLQANRDICNQGVKLVGQGFLLKKSEIKQLGLENSRVIFPFLTNKDLVQRNRELFAIDLYGMSDVEARNRFPGECQRVYDTVRPARLSNRDAQRRRDWWLFGRSNERMRASRKNLNRFIITPEVAKHRPFCFVENSTVPDASLYVFGTDDALFLGILSSAVHRIWALKMGGVLEDRPRYQNGPCFLPFPFPDATEPQKSRIRELGEQLDAHRKRQQAQHPKLTMTGMYNVLEKLRAADSVGQAVPDRVERKRQAKPDLIALTPKEQEIHEQGLVSVLRQIHDDLDAAVADAYGWPADLSDDEILARLVALNHQRAEEERRGLIRWLRPEFQNPTGQQQTAIAVLDQPAVEKKPAKPVKQSWPRPLSEQAAAVQNALTALPDGATAKDVAKIFGRVAKPREERIEEILETLEALGKARQLDDGRYIAV